MSGDKRDKQDGTFVDSLARMTKIVGSPSLDELFRDKGSNNCFNIGPVEADRQMQHKLRSTGGK